MLRALFEWWWNLGRRPAGTEPRREQRRRSDDAHVAAAMVRQLEEIRRLPERAGHGA